ncbi:response regulator transcription factor [Planobispora longispora]|uniref:response regulator transcription factor n=1 Tax=Planobispora longispora TaxID=28887 RepID=UPI0019411A32|nr:response regulator transcription factor [Planobispora longispora]
MILDDAPDIDVVAEASDGRQALDVVARERPDVVLMDIRMPHMDGLTATRRLRERSAAALSQRHEPPHRDRHQAGRRLAAAEGLANSEIADSLHMGVATVKTHVGNVFAKLEVTNRVQVARYVHDADLETPPA